MKPRVANYSGNADRPDQAKALAAVLAVHLALAFIILAGLDVHAVPGTEQSLKTFTIIPSPPPPRPTLRQQRVVADRRKALPFAGPTPKMKSLPIVAPSTAVSSPAPVSGLAEAATAPSSASNGAGISGNGESSGAATGAPDFSRFTPAQLVRNLSSHDYRAIARGHLARGSAMVSLRIEPNGLPGSCSIVRSSGDPNVDTGLCPLLQARLRFRPALDDRGRPIPYQLQYVATWSL